MLEFSGIKIDRNGFPQRFRFRYDLKESYRIAMAVSLKPLTEEETIDSGIIDKKINDIYQNSFPKINRKLEVAKLIRARDITFFFNRNKKFIFFLKVILNELLIENDIPTKWKRVEMLLIGEPLLGLQANYRTMLENGDSFLMHIIEMVKLYFMDDILEKPPENSMLYFVNNQFPLHNWHGTDVSEKIKPQEWKPKNNYCSAQYLLSRLLENLLGKSQKVKESTHSFITSKQYKIHFRYKDGNEQYLSLVPMEIEEVWKQFFFLIFKKFKSSGVRHFLAFIKQMQENIQENFVSIFDWEEHFSLTIDKHKSLRWKKKQIEISAQIFKEIQNLEVIRTFENGRESYEIKNIFLNIISELIKPNERYLNKFSRVNKLKLILDKEVCPNSHQRRFCGLKFIPEKFFSDDNKLFPYLHLIGYYVYDIWTHEKSIETGKTEKTLQEIIEGSDIDVTPSNKYRITNTVCSTLRYMEEQQYIAKFAFQQDKNVERWHTKCIIYTPHSLLRNKFY